MNIPGTVSAKASLMIESSFWDDPRALVSMPVSVVTAEKERKNEKSLVQRIKQIMRKKCNLKKATRKQLHPNVSTTLNYF